MYHILDVRAPVKIEAGRQPAFECDVMLYTTNTLDLIFSPEYGIKIDHERALDEESAMEGAMELAMAGVNALRAAGLAAWTYPMWDEMVGTVKLLDKVVDRVRTWKATLLSGQDDEGGYDFRYHPHLSALVGPPEKAAGPAANAVADSPVRLDMRPGDA